MMRSIKRKFKSIFDMRKKDKVKLNAELASISIMNTLVKYYGEQDVRKQLGLTKELYKGYRAGDRVFDMYKLQQAATKLGCSITIELDDKKIQL